MIWKYFISGAKVLLTLFLSILILAPLNLLIMGILSLSKDANAIISSYILGISGIVVLVASLLVIGYLNKRLWKWN